jgi:cysteinyl-tRNA synthetase
MPNDLVYLYAVADTPPSNQAVSVIEVNSLFALTKYVSADEFSEDALRRSFSNLEWVERQVREHESVIEQAMAGATVVPCKFPTLFHSIESLEQCLRENFSSLQGILAFLVHKEEWGVKVYSNDALFRDAVAQTPHIKELDAEIASASTGKAYLLRKQRDNIFLELLRAKQNEALGGLVQSLRAIAVDVKLNPVLPKAATERDDEMILNAAFLIETASREKFLTTVDAFKQTLTTQGITLEESGAWAAYNFCAFAPKPASRTE